MAAGKNDGGKGSKSQACLLHIRLLSGIDITIRRVTGHPTRRRATRRRRFLSGGTGQTELDAGLIFCDSSRRLSFLTSKSNVLSGRPFLLLPTSRPRNRRRREHEISVRTHINDRDGPGLNC